MNPDPMVIIETHIFTALVKEHMTDDEYLEFLDYLAENPKAGKVIQGTGGLRKIRWMGRGKGKRGGSRVIYYHVDVLQQLRMLLIYGKDEADDLTADQKKALKKVIDTWE